MLQNYLQSAVGMVSEAMFTVRGFDIPYVLLTFIAVLIVALLVSSRHLTQRRLLSIGVILGLLWVGQQSSDFYFNHKFYELQHNWHYFAYAIFVYMSWRVFSRRGLELDQVILYTFLGAISISTFDEGIQVFISDRVFDMSDIGKDSWGSLLGLIFMIFTVHDRCLFEGKWGIARPKFKDYLESPASLLSLAILFTYIFLIVASNLTDTSYWVILMGIVIVIFMLIFLVIHFLQWKVFRRIILSVLALLLLAQGVAFYHYYGSGIVHNQVGLTIYRGIPIPFFDIMIFPDGRFRLVDKKDYFNRRDQQTIKKHAGDILLIGTGSSGHGGVGFPHDEVVQFVFNEHTGRALQIIRLKTPEACDLFNRLQEDGKDVLFIINNS